MARSRRQLIRNGGRRISQQSTGSISLAMSQTGSASGQAAENQKVEESEESEDDELPILPRQSIPDSELSPQYWFLLKVVKYIKVNITVVLKLFLTLHSRRIWGKVRKSDSYVTGTLRAEPLRPDSSNVSASFGEFRGCRCPHQCFGSRRPQVQSGSLKSITKSGENTAFPALVGY